ncbi:MAG: tetratricopeptide repeat protein [Nitrospirota bacterium]|nr:tetratricopeptide repeat protein [Nitrospirota bacterium]
MRCPLSEFEQQKFSITNMAVRSTALNTMNETNQMRCTMMKASLLVTLFVLFGLSAIGCAKKESSMFTLEDEHYQQIMERQKAGINPETEAPVDLTQEMTEDDYEKLGDAHFWQGDFQMAKVQYDKVLQSSPERLPVRYKLAVIYLEKGQSQDAYNQFHQILDYDLSFAPAYEGMGRALLKMEKDDEAEREFQAALLYDSELWTSTNYLGIVADRRHAHKDAIRMYQVALEKKTNHPAVLNNLGMAYYLDQQYDNAVRTFQEALQVGGKSEKIANNLAMTFAKLGHYDLAYDAYARGMEPAMAYNNLGVAFLEERQYARASRCFEKAIETQPTFYEKAKENLSLSNRMLHKLPLIQQQTLIRQEPACL